MIFTDIVDKNSQNTVQQTTAGYVETAATCEEICSKADKKFGYQRETAWCFMSSNTSLSHSRSFEIAPFNNHIRVPIGVSLVTVALSCIISSIKWDISKKSQFFQILHLMPSSGSLSEYCHNVWYGKTRMVWPSQVKQCDDIFSHFNTIPACDRQTDRQTDRQIHGRLATA